MNTSQGVAFALICSIASYFFHLCKVNYVPCSNLKTIRNVVSVVSEKNFLEPYAKLELILSGVHREMLPISWLCLIRISNSSGYQTSLEFGGAYLTFLLNHIKPGG